MDSNHFSTLFSSILISFSFSIFTMTLFRRIVKPVVSRCDYIVLLKRYFGLRIRYRNIPTLDSRVFPTLLFPAPRKNAISTFRPIVANVRRFTATKTAINFSN